MWKALYVHSTIQTNNAFVWREQMTLKRIHINQHVIKANAKSGDRNPVITVKTSKSNQYAHAVHIMGGSTVVYSPDKPLSCGAKVWIETNAEVVLEQ